MDGKRCHFTHSELGVNAPPLMRFLAFHRTGHLVKGDVMSHEALKTVFPETLFSEILLKTRVFENSEVA